MCEKNANENVNLDDTLESVKGEPERWETIRERWEAIFQARLKGETCAVKTDFDADIYSLLCKEEGEGDWRVTCSEVAKEQYMGNERLRWRPRDWQTSLQGLRELGVCHAFVEYGLFRSGGGLRRVSLVARHRLSLLSGLHRPSSLCGMCDARFARLPGCSGGDG